MCDAQAFVFGLPKRKLFKTELFVEIDRYLAVRNAKCNVVRAIHALIILHLHLTRGSKKRYAPRLCRGAYLRIDDSGEPAASVLEHVLAGF